MQIFDIFLCVETLSVVTSSLSICWRVLPRNLAAIKLVFPLPIVCSLVVYVFMHGICGSTESCASPRSRCATSVPTVRLVKSSCLDHSTGACRLM